MSSHMSNGLIAHERTMEKPDGELVHIFAYEENDLTNDIQQQGDQWTQSSYTKAWNDLAWRQVRVSWAVAQRHDSLSFCFT